VRAWIGFVLFRSKCLPADDTRLPERRENLRAKGKDDAFIDAYLRKFQTFKIIHSKMIGRKLEKEGGRSERIKESCYAETFEKDGATVDVQGYYSRYYGIELRFPHLPIVSVGGKGYFPIEFLYQERSRVGGNEKHRQEEVLKYHDRFAASRRADRVRTLKDYAYGVNTDYKSLEELLKDFQVSIEAKPLESRAEILPCPVPRFRNRDGLVAQGTGSWNLNGQVFARPADLVMPVILDFTNDDRGRPVESIMATLFKTMKLHGMGVCPERSLGTPGWSDLVFKYNRRDTFTFDKASTLFHRESCNYGHFTDHGID